MNFLDNLMSPLNRDHCALYYWLGLISFFLAAIGVIHLILNLLNRSKADKSVSVLALSIISNLVMYYLTRIQYSVCIAALH